MRRLPLAVPLLILGLGAAGCGQPTVNVVQPFAVVNWSPQDGATCIASDWTLGVCMSRAVDAKTLAQVKVRPLDASGTAGTAVKTTNAVSKNDASCVTLTPPSAGLAPNAEFEIELDKGFGSSDGATLGQTLTSRFHTTAPGCPSAARPRPGRSPPGRAPR